jgi:23S rRNA (cytidine1920-2'-O)/16S rRNA (cytidine1409-2'-O)-methyltransferase
MSDPDCPYVSRGGLKLAAALEAFGLDVHGLVCADLGCNVGGFTDCLLQHGAARVYSVDTGYGQLAWTLRNDPRVVVMERTNALRVGPPAPGGPDCDLVVIDLGWTKQRLAIPAARKWLRNAATSRIITLIKPHYEADRAELGRADRGVLSEADAEVVHQRVLSQLPEVGAQVLGHIRSPIRGGAGKGRTGNIEYLALLAATAG